MSYQKFLLGTCVIGLSVLGACSQDHKGNVSLKRVEVHQEQFAKQVTSHDLKQSDLEALAADYNRYGGDDPLTLSVQYDPASSENTAMNATRHASKLANGLRAAGVTNVKTEILPVVGVGDHSRTLITYERYSAHKPEGCGTMPGMDNTTTDWEAMRDYGFGCSVEDKIARQIARPKDLLGNDRGLEGEDDGRRASNIIETYRLGEPNEPLEGEQASEN